LSVVWVAFVDYLYWCAWPKRSIFTGVRGQRGLSSYLHGTISNPSDKAV
jgi:hypothetical protein